MSKLKILVLDIETGPAKAYVWTMFGVNVGIEQLIDPSRVLSVGRKWLGEKGVRYDDTWPYTDKKSRREMLKKVRAELLEADAVITFNGNKFDLPKLNGEFLVEGLKPVKPPVSIDVRKTTSAMGFTSGKLAHVGPLLGCGRKRKHDGFTLWADYLAGKPAARKEMRLYNIQDVIVLEQVYEKVKPFIKAPAYLTEDMDECPNCAGHRLEKRGHRYTRMFKIERRVCLDCGAWSDGTRRKKG